MKKILILVLLFGSFFSCKKEGQDSLTGAWKVAETYRQFDQDSLVNTQASTFTIKLKKNGVGLWQPKDDKVEFSWRKDANTVFLDKTNDNLNPPFVIAYGVYEVTNDEADSQNWVRESTLVSHILEQDTFIMLTTIREWELVRQ